MQSAKKDGPRLVTIFGESKTVEAWSRDPRCEVSATGLARRLRAGVAAEEALLRSYSPARKVAASDGERKSVADWSRDPRCEVAKATLRMRISRGIDPVVALRKELPEAAKGKFLAFGEWKSLRGWVEDARCRVGYSGLLTRVKSGMPLERAITAPLNVNRYSAFGESKTLGEWAADPRCQVHRETLRHRMMQGCPLERALMMEKQTGPNARLRAPRYTAFGETKTLSEWAEDTRCRMAPRSIGVRLRRGTPFEEALTTPPKPPKAPYKNPVYCEAFGERKTVSAWRRDPRCAVTARVLRERLRRGISAELALMEPKHIAYEHSRPRNVPVEAFGERWPLREWSKDPRCVVSYERLCVRIRKGFSPEVALTRPLKNFPPRPMTAFGESKTVVEWSRDPRCEVSLGGLRERLRTGLALETALRREKRGIRFASLEAFGEIKSLADWQRDERCHVSLSCLRSRLDNGQSLEDALRPSDALRFRRFWDLKARGLQDLPLPPQPASGSGMEAEAVKVEAAVRPSRKPRRVRSKQSTTSKQYGVLLTHRGECKPLREWAADPRCQLTLEDLEKCLKSGRSLSEVIALGRLALKAWIR